MSARITISKDAVTVIAAVIAMGLMIWGIVFMVGEIVRMDQGHMNRIATENQQQQEAPVAEESVYDDATGTYGPVIRPNGKVGMGTDMGGGVVISPSGKVGFGFGF